MKHQPSGLSAGLPLLIDAHWSAEQALAVFEVLDDLRECIWQRYGTSIQALLHQQRTQAAEFDAQFNQPLDEDWPF